MIAAVSFSALCDLELNAAFDLLLLSFRGSIRKDAKAQSTERKDLTHLLSRGVALLPAQGLVILKSRRPPIMRKWQGEGVWATSNV